MEKNDLIGLQRQQLKHDSQYHQDILYLPLPDKLKHIALHLAKYPSNLLVDKNYKKDCADTLICTLAIGNALRHCLNRVGDQARRVNFEEYISEYIITLGKIVKAVEALDHVEDYPSHQVLTEQTEILFNNTIVFIKNIGINPVEIIRSRWKFIENNYFLGK